MRIPKAPSAVKPGLPHELDSIVLKALNKNPLNRYQTAAEMRSDLVRALSGQAVHATPIMSDEERTQVMRPGPQQVGVVAGPSLLAPPRPPVPDDMWDDEEEDRSKKVWGYVGIGVLCLALLAGAIFLTLQVTKKDNKPAQVAAPQVQGMTLAAAEKSITDAGLKVGTTKTVESSTVPRGTVTKQDPSQGTPIDLGQPVNLEVSKGVTAVTVPNLKTLSPAQAETQLAGLNLLMKSVGVTSTDAEKNTVVGQSPAVNTSVKPGSTVTVQVGNGPNFTKVPTDLVGKSYDQAVAELKAANLTATQQVVDGIQPLNTVVKVTGVTPGASVQEGTPVVLQTSNNQLFTVPPLANLSPEDAATNLNNLGWSGNAGSFQKYGAQTTDGTLIGKIASGPQDVANPQGGTMQKPGQNPAAGATARKNAQFQVVVYTKKQIALPTFTPGVTSTDEAVGALQNLGASNIKVVTQQPATPPAVPHTYISMTPNSGSVVDFDTEITVTVWGDAPAPPTTPKTTPTTPAKPSTGAAPPATTPAAGRPGSTRTGPPGR